MTQIIWDIIPIGQRGHLCKIVVIAMIEQYYAQQMGFVTIPLNKNRNPIKSYQTFKSIRQYIKEQYGSVQGEMLEIKQVDGALRNLGYKTSLVEFTNQFDLFKQVIIESITAGNLIFIAFSVDLAEGTPTTTPSEDDKNEHAAVIHGFDDECEHVYITHWGQEWICTFKELYDASLTLLDTRAVEYYQNLSQGRTLKGYKHELIKVEDITEKNRVTIRESVKPQLDSGFRGRLIVVEKPDSPILMQKIRKELFGFNPLRPQEILSFPQGAVTAPHVYPLDVALRNLAQYFLDGELDGTPLNGMCFTEALNYVADFLNWIPLQPQTEELIKPTLQHLARQPLLSQQNLFHSLIKQLQIMQWYETEKKQIIKNFKDIDVTNKEHLLLVDNALIELGIQLLQRLDECSDIFFGGGFITAPSHSLTYRLSRQGKKIYFCVYDSLKNMYHETAVLDSGKTGYYPGYAFHCSQHEDKTQIAQFLGALLRFEILPRLNQTAFIYHENDLYKVLLSAPTWLNGTVVSSAKLAKAIVGKRSGTCVAKTLTYWLQAMIGERNSYRQLLLAYRLYLFNRFAQEHKLETLPVDVKVILRRALANLVRMLNPQLKSEAHVFDSWQTDILTQVKDWKVKLSITEPKINQCIVHYIAEQLPKLETNFQLAQPLIIDTVPHQFSDNKVSVMNQFNQFDKAVIVLNQLLDFPDIHVSIYIGSIENFCFYFTDPATDLTFLTPLTELKHQFDVLNGLWNILKKYQRYHTQPTPRSVVMYLSLMSIIDRLSEEKLFILVLFLYQEPCCLDNQ